MKSSKVLKKVRIVSEIFTLSVLLLIGGLLLFLTLAEYRPASIEEVKVEGGGNHKIRAGEEVSLLSWNIGYFALGEKADFFMDGGKMVRGFSEEAIQKNLSDIAEEIKERKPDILLLQEVDKKSYRSFDVDEIQGLMAALPFYEGGYARNFKAAFVPYPFPPIRYVDAGLLTLSSWSSKEMYRHALSSPFKWPVKTVNLKRCLLVNRIPIKQSEKELVVLNLHLEAYDDTGGAFLQFSEMMEIMGNEVEKGNYVIAGGDFNQTFSHIKPKNIGRYGEKTWKPNVISPSDERFFYLMDEETPSCRSLEKPYEKTEDFPKYVIDGFIVSKNIEVKELRTLPLDFKNSDHNPVYLKVKLK